MMEQNVPRMEFTYDQLIKYGFESHPNRQKCNSCKSKFDIVRKRIHISPNLKGYQCYNCFNETHRAPNIFTTKVPMPIFEQMVSGLKKSYIDLASSEYEIGDTLIFQEYDAVNSILTENELITEISSITDVENQFSPEDIWDFGLILVDYKTKMLYDYQEEDEFKIHDCKDNLSECMVISPQIHNGVTITRPKWHLVENLTKRLMVQEINGCPFCLKPISEF